VRLLGVDYGGVRTGLALSDPLGVTCTPLEVLREPDEGRLVTRIAEVVREHEVTEVVVGLPRPLGGGSNAQLLAAEGFLERLAAVLPVSVRGWDERFTSKLAERSRASARPKAKARGRGRGPAPALDAVAACHLLQSYLDGRSRGRFEAS
jgi:putative holliday junction resolvase